MKKIRLKIFKSTAFVCMTSLIISCGPKKQEEAEDKTVMIAVQTIVPGTGFSQNEYIGTIESDNQLDVSFLSMGNIEKMYVNEGQRVSKGQILASINKTSLQSAYTLTLATLRQAEDAFRRLSAMYESKNLPEIQFIDAKTKLEQAQASEVIARKSLQDAEIYAPQSGIIGKKYLEAGASVMPGTPIYQILDINSVKVKTAIPEGEISNIKIGTSCDIKISALDNKIFQGDVIEKGVTANPISHTYDIKIKLDNKNGIIMPGMVCRTYLNSSKTADNDIIVPIKSVQVDVNGKRFVWLKGKDNKAMHQEVTLGKLVDNGVIIQEGLRIGDDLITDGYQNVSEGVSVTIFKNKDRIDGK